MKKSFITILCILPLITNAQTVIVDTVSTGANYINQIWYSLQNDEVASQAKDNWDLGFELTGFNSSILVNTQKSGVACYQSPYNWANWNAFDTTGYKQWQALHNSDTTWEIGALSRNGVYDTEDMGWGSYDMSSHAIVGTRLFLLSLPGNKLYKLGIKSLISGVYTVTYKSIDNTDSTTFTVKKADYSNKHFAYYSFDTKATLDREPDYNDWDITFTKYIYNNYPLGGGQFMPYGVTGILQNKGVKVAEVIKTDLSITDYQNRTFATRMNEIGSDWKTFNNTTFQFTITDSLVYFVEDKDNNIWKVIMTGFSGGTAGNYMFSKQKLGNLSVYDFDANNTISIYPNPSNGNSITLISDLQSETSVDIIITDMQGKVVYEQRVSEMNGFNALEIPVEFGKGVYNVTLQNGSNSVTKKLVRF